MDVQTSHAASHALPLVPSANHAPGRCALCPVRSHCLPSWSDSGTEFERLQIGQRRVRKGQAIYREGDPFFFMYAVRAGTFKSTVTLKEGRDQVIAFHLPGEIIGFDGLANGHHPSTAAAMEDSEVCAVPFFELNESAEKYRLVRNHINSLITTELVRERSVMSLIATTHSVKRVAAFLLNLASRMQERGYSAREIQLRMTREEIGGYLGMTLETVCRSLTAFAKQGYIDVHRRHIEILDTEGLCNHYGLSAKGYLE